MNLLWKFLIFKYNMYFNLKKWFLYKFCFLKFFIKNYIFIKKLINKQKKGEFKCIDNTNSEKKCLTVSGST